MLLVGIDEAGYGPILGPMVMSAAAFRLPDELAENSLWELLSSSTTDRVTQKERRLILADSKKVYSGQKSIRHLERSALASIWTATGERLTSLSAVMRAVSISADALAAHQWYGHSDRTLPTTADENELRIATKLFTQELTDIGGQLAAVKVLPLVESEFNRLIDQMRNKSRMQFSQTVRLMESMFASCPNERRVDFFCDRQGGKTHYVNDLMRVYGEAKLEVLAESDTHSGYRMTFADRVVSLHFMTGGESRHLPIAMASIVSKYVREVFMMQFNAYWQTQCPGIEPTAGYWTDGKRFLADLSARLGEANVPLATLTRKA